MEQVQREPSPNILVALVANKIDLVRNIAVDLKVRQRYRGRHCLTFPSSSLSLLSSQEAQAYADENGQLFMETSAKMDLNVNELFMTIG